MLVTTAHFPLADAVNRVRNLFLEQQQKADALAETFACA
jgi:hypothetical protein